jgi:hypothetical protein
VRARSGGPSQGEGRHATRGRRVGPAGAKPFLAGEHVPDGLGELAAELHSGHREEVVVEETVGPAA